MQGWLYLIKNEALAGVIKIGRSDDSPEVLINKLDLDGAVPTPFQLSFKVFVRDSYLLVQNIRKTLWAQGENAGSGWFSITEDDGISIVRTQIALYIVDRIRLEIRNGHGHNDFDTTMRVIDQVLFLQENTYLERNSISEAREVAKIVAYIMKKGSWMCRDLLSLQVRDCL